MNKERQEIEEAVDKLLSEGCADKRYTIHKSGNKWVVKDTKGKVRGTHDTEGKAREQQKALYAQESVDEAAYPGYGMGLPRRGTDSKDTCYCPECAYEMRRLRGRPCRTVNCPRCGTQMTGGANERAPRNRTSS